MVCEWCVSGVCVCVCVLYVFCVCFVCVLCVFCVCLCVLCVLCETVTRTPKQTYKSICGSLAFASGELPPGTSHFQMDVSVCPSNRDFFHSYQITRDLTIVSAPTPSRC